MDRLAAMAQFVRVVEAGSFSAAARSLGQGQPALSKAIAQLEAYLGTRLLTRTTRALSPTEAGRTFYAHAVAAIDAADAAEAVVRASTAALAGPLRVCAPVTFARLHIVPKLATFLESHPGITLDLVLDDRRIDLVSEGIDLAVRAGPLDDSSLIASHLGHAERVVVAAPHWAAANPVDTPDALRDAGSVIYAGARKWIFARDGETRLVALRQGLSVNAVEGQRAAVIAGLGPTIASRWAFADAISNGTVGELLSDWTLPQVDLWLVAPAGRQMTRRARAFADFLKSAMPL